MLQSEVSYYDAFYACSCYRSFFDGRVRPNRQCRSAVGPFPSQIRRQPEHRGFVCQHNKYGCYYQHNGHRCRRPRHIPELCANIYTFDPAEEMVSCCTCVVTPNGLQSLSVLKSLISNPLTPAIPTSVVIKIFATTVTPTCNASVGGSISAHGLLAWGTTLHQNTSTAKASYSVTETPFSQAVLSEPELDHLYTTCGFIQANGSGFGICKGCSAGGLGAGASNQ